MRLSDRQMALLQEVLRGPESDAFFHLMRSRLYGEPPSGAHDAAEHYALQLGWLERPGGPLTTEGATMSHPFREMLNWEERDREMPGADVNPLIRAERFSGQDVLEVGSGFGVNLLTLSSVATSVSGVEIEEAYVQLTPLLSEKAGLPAPQVQVSPAETMPFESQCYDSLLCVGALQYMDLLSALREMKRVTRPGGQILLVLSHLSGYVRESLPPALRSPRETLRELRAVATMVTYPWLGRAFAPPHTPVHPTHAGMRRWLNRAGLELVELHQFGHETAYVARA